eukprot:5834767-Prymnesium_polylepis.1
MAVWARYIRSYDRALLVALGEGVHGDTTVEIAVSMFGLFGGTAMLAYLTSAVVEMVRGMNALEETSRQKINQARHPAHPMRVASWPLPHASSLLWHYAKQLIGSFHPQVRQFMNNAKLPRELQARVKDHLEHVLLRR